MLAWLPYCRYTHPKRGISFAAAALLFKQEPFLFTILKYNKKQVWTPYSHRTASKHRSISHPEVPHLIHTVDLGCNRYSSHITGPIDSLHLDPLKRHRLYRHAGRAIQPQYFGVRVSEMRVQVSREREREAERELREIRMRANELGSAWKSIEGSLLLPFSLRQILLWGRGKGRDRTPGSLGALSSGIRITYSCARWRFWRIGRSILWWGFRLWWARRVCMRVYLFRGRG